MKTRTLCICLALSCYMLPIKPAQAITADLAKKCREMALKAYSSRQPGSKEGFAKAQREYYRDCIAKNGDVEKEVPARRVE
jgi:hypothetical protein